MHTISPFLWFSERALEAADFYVSVFGGDSTITGITRQGDAPDAPVMVVDFVLNGTQFHALNGGDQFPFTPAVSFSVAADDQAAIDYYWDALTADGGEGGQCGWLTDRFGLSWQIVPPVLAELIGGHDPQRSAMAMQAMLGMGKLDIAALREAYDNTELPRSE